MIYKAPKSQKESGRMLAESCVKKSKKKSKVQILGFLFVVPILITNQISFHFIFNRDYLSSGVRSFNKNDVTWRIGLMVYRTQDVV